MSITALSGPLVVFGQAPYLDYNPDLGPSLFYGGVGLLDQRATFGYEPGQAAGNLTAGWYGANAIQTLTYIPSAQSATSIAASQAPTSGTAVTLVTSSAGVVTSGASVVNAATGALVTGLRVLEPPNLSMTASIAGNVLTLTNSGSGLLTIGSVLSGTSVASGQTVIGAGTGSLIPGTGLTGTYIVSIPQTVASTTIVGVAGIAGVPRIPFGPSGTVQLYNPWCSLARNVRITTASGDTAVYTVSGYDIYGYPMTEAITANGATTVSGKKAFKWISSVVPVGTVGATVTVGTGDVFGFPLYSGSFYDLNITWAGANITATTGYTAGVTTAASSTTGDVRGTYAVQSASDGTKELVIVQSPSPWNAATMSGIFGVTQA
jgi:hypothetical protein